MWRNGQGSDEESICPLLGRLTDEIMITIFSILTGDAALEEYRRLFLSFGLASKACRRVCIKYVQKMPVTKMVLFNARRCFLNLSNWLVKHKVKIGSLVNYLNPENRIETHAILQVALACDLTDLRDLEIEDRIETHSDHHTILNDLFTRKALAAGVPHSVIDPYHNIHAAFVQKASALEKLSTFLIKETYHRPILSNFSYSLIHLKLHVFSINNDNYGATLNYHEEISEAIENMYKLEFLELIDISDEEETEELKPIKIRSKSLHSLEVQGIFLMECLCPFLQLLHCYSESVLHLDGDILDFESQDEDLAVFEAGVCSIKLYGIHVPQRCQIQIETI